jgi:hypothetical protein
MQVIQINVVPLAYPIYIYGTTNASYTYEQVTLFTNMHLFVHVTIIQHPPKLILAATHGGIYAAGIMSTFFD